jgi:membrane-associated protein
VAHQLGVDYAGIAFAAWLTWIGLPGPGEGALVAAGIAASHGRLDLASVLVAAWLGAIVGGVAGWLAGRHGGRRLVLAGRWMRGPRVRALEHGNRFFERYSLVAVYLVPSWACGVNAMSAGRFLSANALCTGLWAVALGVGAYALGPSIRDVAADVGVAGTTALVLAVIGGAVLARRSRGRADPTARAARRE